VINPNFLMSVIPESATCCARWFAESACRCNRAETVNHVQDEVTKASELPWPQHAGEKYHLSKKDSASDMKCIPKSMSGRDPFIRTNTDRSRPVNEGESLIQ